LLRALGVSAAAAPFIPALDGWAAASPQRLLLLFSPHGVIPQTVLAHRGREGLRLPGRRHPGAVQSAQGGHGGVQGPEAPTKGRGAHEIVMGNLWTGTGLALPTQDANGPSIDQIIAKSRPARDHLRVAAVRGAVFVVGRGGHHLARGSVNSSMIYAAAHQRLYPENDPYRMFDRLFAGAGAARARATRWTAIACAPSARASSTT
jgi:hypothetical protein